MYFSSSFGEIFNVVNILFIAMGTMTVTLHLCGLYLEGRILGIETGIALGEGRD